MANTRIKLNDNTSIPLLGFGTGTAHIRKDAQDSVAAAINAGFTHFDCAQYYQNEDSLGAAIAASGKPREQLFITTKLGRPVEGKTVRDTLVESLAKLRLDYVDLFLIHTPRHYYKHPGGLKAVWKDMETVTKERLTRSIGVSNFRPPELREILDDAEILPSVNQIEFHPYIYKDVLPTLELQKKYGIVTASYGGLSPIFRVRDGPLEPVLASIAKRLSDTTGRPFNEAQVLFLWQREKGVVIVTTTKQESRSTEYLDTLNAPTLTEIEIALIDEAGAKEHHRFFPMVILQEGEVYIAGE
ncbi:Aldo/keto reductase [Russula earlei]|uniref:Aldo/keto reductase n=1 Tax=Russula earlei TaxID=71964 RepID=A0ACC0UJX4_9AGAM|nr:Aldo/keto reductase [Russula earlei]